MDFGNVNFGWLTNVLGMHVVRVERIAKAGELPVAQCRRHLARLVPDALVAAVGRVLCT